MTPIPGPLRCLVVAPFDRGLDHGGSQRATALAERLEERGVSIKWQTIDGHPVSHLAKLQAMIALRPTGIAMRPPRELKLGEGIDFALAAHSYLAPQLASVGNGIPRVIDFHNLEWQHLADSAEFARGSRGSYLQIQAALMRRFERRTVADNDLCLFTSVEELGWAGDSTQDEDLMLIPSVLPRQAAEAALEMGARERGPIEPQLVYVGTVRFPPNLGALNEFLRGPWPAIRAAIPDARLTIAGDCDDDDRLALSAHPGVEALGFVEDINSLLERSAAVVMPISGRAGTSLRALYYALSGTWAIGTPAAFRGLSWKMGTTVDSTEQWVEAVREAFEEGSGHEQHKADARSAALALQRDSEPWDHLYRRVSEMAAIGAHRG